MPTTAAADPDSFCTVIVSWAGRRGRQSVSKGLSGGQQRSHLAPEKSTTAHSLHTHSRARLSHRAVTTGLHTTSNRARIHASLLPAASPQTCSGPALWANSGARGGTRVPLWANSSARGGTRVPLWAISGARGGTRVPLSGPTAAHEAARGSRSGPTAAHEAARGSRSLGQQRRTRRHEGNR